ncbi:hypothetical protein [Hyphomicrobium sp.]|uniref:hypothetical protein n=1 Tax=Hyphomicrobium sp. TaxID=82 RepID=UPI002E330BF6|nr:hypothetical protein [Hyphomicrobium sp.]HEX2841358.1 hypothetical protein [Hyphomicrobium sp.]
MLSGLTASMPIALITERRLGEIQSQALAETTLAALLAVLRKSLKAVERPEDLWCHGASL